MELRRNNRAARILPIIIVIGVCLGIAFISRASLIRFADERGLIARIPPAIATPLASLGLFGDPEAVDLEGDHYLIFPGEEQLAADGFPIKPRTHVLKYKVQQGDTLFGIAAKFGLNPDTIFWSNAESLKDNINLLFVGVDLYILPVDGVYHEADGEQSIAEIAALYSVQSGDILYSEYNHLSEYELDTVPPVGMRIVIPGGRREYISWQAPIETGLEGSGNPEGAVHPGSCRARYSGAGGTQTYVNPLGSVLYRITNGYASWHPGVDLASDHGTPIYAADTGVVVFAGWHREGYGELVIIDHGNGWTTYYGHNSKRFVGCGDQVTQGQIIAEMGMSGNATGVHVHFEIRQNDVTRNPADYITLQDMRAP